MALALKAELPVLTLVKPSRQPTVEDLTQQVLALQSALRDTLTILAYAGISGTHLVHLPDVIL